MPHHIAQTPSLVNSFREGIPELPLQCLYLAIIRANERSFTKHVQRQGTCANPNKVRHRWRSKIVRLAFLGPRERFIYFSRLYRHDRRVRWYRSFHDLRVRGDKVSSDPCELVSEGEAH